MPRGFFISFEGLCGAGKTTQTTQLAEALKQAGRPVVKTREPGGTLFGQHLRELLLPPTTPPRTPEAEALMFAADRAQHVGEVIRPALEQGKIVICDRFTDSTRAYQGGGCHLPDHFIETVIGLATGGLEPDLTFLLDVPVEEALARLVRRGRLPNRFDLETRDFHQRVRKQFRDLADAHPMRIYVLDATRPPDNIHAQVWEVVEERLKAHELRHKASGCSSSGGHGSPHVGSDDGGA